MKTLCFDYKFDFLKKGWLSWHPWILNSKVLVRNQIIFIWGWLLTALSRVEHFILKQVIDPDNSKASQRTKSLASFLNMCVCVCVCACMLSCVWLFATHGLQPTRLLCPWNFPGKNTGAGWYFLLQWISPTQGSNPHLLCLLYHWATNRDYFLVFFLTHAAPVMYKTESKPSGNAVERMNTVINIWMKLYIINWLLIVPCHRLT